MPVDPGAVERAIDGTAPAPQPPLREAVNLSNCDREPIHIPGAIQPHGCLLVCRLPAWIVEHASANAAAVIGPDAAVAGTVVGRPLEALLSAELVHDLRNLLQTAMATGSAERLPDVAVGAGRADAAVHALDATRAVVELSPRTRALAGGDPLTLVKGMIGRLRRAPDLDRFFRLAATQVRAVTGFDRVMIYRFLHDGTGEVVAETLASGMEPYLGLRYPASDIPVQARALYKRQWLRLIPDVDYRSSPVLPERDREGQPVDMGLAGLRSVSPIHLEYLRNMGAAATLTVSILRGGELWGLIACHHRSPRTLPAETLAACELFGQIFSIQIEAKEAQILAAEQARSRLAHDRLMAGMSPEDTIFDNLATFGPTLMELIACDGIGVWSEERFTGHGTVPPPEAIDGLIDLLSRSGLDRPFVEDSLSTRLPGAAAWADRVSGLLSIGFSRSPRDYLMFFRREVVQDVRWGGNPTKPVEPTGPNGDRLHPRKSFTAWRQEVRGRALPWTAAEVDVATTLRVSLLEVILRRSDLLAHERRSAQESQALLIAELNHRVKNVLALIRSLVRQSRQGATSVGQFTGDLESRIRSLALAHDQLSQIGWRGAPLRGLLEAEAEAWSPGTARDRVVLTGPPVDLDSRAYQGLALVFHELTTNAAKYGALTRPTGRVLVDWRLDPNGDLHIDWREGGGPAVQAPSRRGFGSVVVERTVPFELRGEARIEYRLEGVHAAFLIPAEHVSPAEEAAAAPAAEAAPARLAMAGRRVLLVEDSMMIALDAQEMLEEAGAEVEVVANAADGLRAVANALPSVAVLDINLTGETSFPVADVLLAAGVPFVFATGYGESVAIPERFAGVPVATKPYDDANLAVALGRAAAHA